MLEVKDCIEAIEEIKGCVKGVDFSYYVEGVLVDGCTMTQSFRCYDYEKAKKTYDEMRKNKAVVFVRLVECRYLQEEEVNNGVDD